MAKVFGGKFPDNFNNQTVIDFGCGEGRQSIALAMRGARVFGFDINDRGLDAAKKLADLYHVKERVSFFNVKEKNTLKNLVPSHGVDWILSYDAFEHYSRPGQVLNIMKDLLASKGKIVIQFGPPWFHPFGAICISLPRFRGFNWCFPRRRL